MYLIKSNIKYRLKMRVVFMWLKLIFLQCIFFIALAGFCKGMIFLLQKYLLSKQYKLTSGCYYVLSCSLMFVLSISLGKEYLFLIL